MYVILQHSKIALKQTNYNQNLHCFENTLKWGFYKKKINYYNKKKKKRVKGFFVNNFWYNSIRHRTVDCLIILYDNITL